MNDSTSKTSKRHIPGLILLSLASIILGIWVAQQSNTPRPLPSMLTATLLPQAKPISHFDLSDHQNQAFKNQQLSGRWSFLFFGYTHCPDVCPTTLSVLSQVASQLEKQSLSPKDYQVVFVTVDPERDSAAHLRDYVGYFNPNFVGVRGTIAELTRFSRELGIIFQKDPKTEGSSYLVDHSASIILMNPAGQMAAVFSAPHNAQDIATDFLKIRNFSNG